MVTLPALWLVANAVAPPPDGLTLTTVGLVLVHVAVGTVALPSLYLAVAINVADCPRRIMLGAWVIDREVKVGTTTVGAVGAVGTLEVEERPPPPPQPAR